MKASITFEPSGAAVWVEPGTTVHEAALAGGVPLSAPCGGRGVCGACGVRVVAGELDAPDAVEAERLGSVRPGVRLGCRATVSGRVTVRPVISLVADTSDRPPLPASARTAVAVDLGTTNVSAVGVDLDTGVEGPVATVPNSQGAYGADVLSRIAAADSGDADALQRSARDSVTSAIALAIGSTEVAPVHVVIAGNTAMEALLAGVNAGGLGRHPFEAPTIPDSFALTLKTGGIGARLMPTVSSFVGGDTAACLLHTGMAESGRTQLLIDFGTNAEIALVHQGRLWVASAAAGPAFEASGIECGGTAGPGSVVSVGWDDDCGWSLKTLADAPAERFTGSGLVSIAALLRRLGHLQPDGRMLSDGPLASFFGTGEDGVVRVKIGSGAAPTLSQLDVRALQLAKAAVRVGVEYVLRAAGLSARELERVHVAGAFGAGLRVADLTEIGVIPAEVADIVAAVGNASLYGALAAAVTPELIDELERDIAEASHVDLAGDAGFQTALMAAVELAPYRA